jgi:2'-5' RNA ligase
MIKLKELLLEGQKNDYGCLMAMVNDIYSRKILNFNYDLIDEESLHVKGNDYGRECNCHVTLKYGFTKNYTDSEMKKIISKIKPFTIRVSGISLFEGDGFDVVKMDVKSDILHKINGDLSKLPNEDKHPIYHPHLTLEYVKKGLGKKFIKQQKKFSNIPINTLLYSKINGEKVYYNL